MTSVIRALVLAFLLVGLAVPAAQVEAAMLPDPIIKMSDALEDISSSRRDLTGSMTVYDSKKKALTVNVTARADTDENTGATQGKGTIKVDGPLLKEELNMKKLSASVEFRLLPERDEAYFRISKFPKFGLFDFTKAAKKWIVVDMEELDLMGIEQDESPVFASFAEVQAKYPAFVFTAQKSTKKEYVYSYRVNLSLLPQFVNEHRRLMDQDPLPLEDLEDSFATIDSLSGTIAIDKKTYLPTRESAWSMEDGFDTDITMKYSFGNPVKVQRPSGAMTLEELESMFDF